ncbi:MAG: hypothetical protein GEU80_12280 [Dehalococcoidia bacterium]|nr:hypothetical protein [Dehalococcoidia bacterium]
MSRLVRRRFPGGRSVIDAASALSGVLLALVAYAYVVPLEPLEARGATPGTVVLDAQGGVLERDRREGLRIPVTLDEVAPIMVQATLAAEDQRFRSHPGVDPLAMARAASEVRSSPSGASTITQQLARRLYLEDADLPLPLRKAREALTALQLEARYSKEELLTAYLNDVYYGRGAYGIEAAARVYFGVSARHLTTEQAALLAGLPQLPAAYEPADHPGPARERRAYVLGRLRTLGVVDAAEAERADAAPLALAPLQPEPLAPHFAGYVFDELARLRPDLASLDGLVIETTLDPHLQRQAARSVDVRLAQLEEHRAGSAAVVVVDPVSGAVLTMVGGRDFESADGGRVNMALALRQPGSALKPLLYAAALERGYTPATTLLDVPTTIETPSGPYTPHNYDLTFHGPVPLRVALASSLNVPAVRTVEAIGVEALLDMAQRVGIESLEAAEAYGAALTLGAGEVPLLDLTAAYATLAAEGQRVEPYVIERVRDASGRVLY